MPMILKHWQKTAVVPLYINEHFGINLEYIPGWCLYNYTSTAFNFIQIKQPHSEPEQKIM